MSVEAIRQFRGAYWFLSNFYQAEIEFSLRGEQWTAPTVEHAFQAAKALVLVGPSDYDTVVTGILSQSTPALAKDAGRALRIDKAKWGEIAYSVMERLVTLKFEQHQDLMNRLVATRPATLIEGNLWGDRIWGVDIRSGVGENLLGKILMSVRDGQ